MEKVYRKKENGRYEAIGYNHPDISDGIWLVQTNPSHRSVTNLVWLVGNIDEPANIINHATMQSMKDELAQYILNLQNEDSKEYKEAKEILGGYLKQPPSIYNISSGNLIQLVLREIAKKL